MYLKWMTNSLIILLIFVIMFHLYFKLSIFILFCHYFGMLSQIVHQKQNILIRNTLSMDFDFVD